eukprot:CAMPEP_0182434246 /NCGR_PEP_ID=MMETSP1167-20130531/68642_1 /TAXON_ID=2988 /ORGANISM="Mallomonas Sp, Strain CCMP3275" /LENGTH=97 /DNA_ID=CAMNT_0024623897 /DNA_START=1 /DNA_END=291 /DNA_ORIENTATION=+
MKRLVKQMTKSKSFNWENAVGSKITQLKELLVTADLMKKSLQETEELKTRLQREIEQDELASMEERDKGKKETYDEKSQTYTDSNEKRGSAEKAQSQ